MGRVYFVILTILFTVAGSNASGQDYDEATRSVTLNYRDSTIYFRVIREKPYKIDKPRYAIYSKGKIQEVDALISGSPLHGVYEVFDAERNIIRRGEYYRGVKHGRWIEFTRDGHIKSNQNWKRGERVVEKVKKIKKKRKKSKRKDKAVTETEQKEKRGFFKRIGDIFKGKEKDNKKDDITNEAVSSEHNKPK
jgi:hypothetical protein